MNLKRRGAERTEGETMKRKLARLKLARDWLGRQIMVEQGAVHRFRKRLNHGGSNL